MESIGERGTTIQEFYRGASVLITGETGFMGKVLVEKLLRSCPHLSSVYLLVRSKKGKDAESRLDDLFNDPLFGNLQDQMPKFRHKVTAISGDCSMPGLGLIPSDRNLLTEEVSFVFHGAATVRFDEKLRIAMGTNVAGTENVLELAHDMKKLKAVIHISTAYCNCHLQEIQEKFYSYPLTYQKLSAFMDGVNDKMVDAITPHLLGEWPNTYAFTKAMAEDLVRDKGLGLPIGVFRPAIVVATRDEPVSGWIDNLYGPTGVVVGAATGLIKTLHGDAGVNADIVPVDMAVNAVIVSAWEVANKPRAHTADEIPLYNYVSSVQKPLTWGQFMDKVSRYGIHVPTVRTVWCYSFTLNKHRSLHLMYVLFLHFLPAFIIDGVTMLFGNKPKLVKIYKKINKFCSVLSYFGNREWKFTNNNIQGLWEKLNENDKKLFDFDIDGLDWDNYFYKYVRGIRIYLMKDDLSTVPQGLARQKRYINIL
ncbi:fatty acyl-CoA reductase wat-like [Zootermopsis nevadensis]|uniref:Fatty acyl-CoA reductase n=1 Tax=Zootermopsis nevadensis TaxID=136037 RepID=A0A067QQS7_ZOONE|nr:fatty acyl-CoA reductase wat-like [Zootermopsis nevadensis]XP_021940990.1 fatty acyl-CoA reductase wat-like [Zootermopsis nevadensis]KDR07123.1 Putative fatty acyl-CoA reductase [Zootermopsis nevadensis]